MKPDPEALYHRYLLRLTEYARAQRQEMDPECLKLPASPEDSEDLKLWRRYQVGEFVLALMRDPAFIEAGRSRT